jgi:hypothetical protein
MNEAAFSPQTLAFLQQFGADLPSAIAAAPDADLQRVSAGYREVRQQMDEGRAKALMLGRDKPAAGEQQPSERQPLQRPPSQREQLLTAMLEMATLPDLQEMLATELAVESAVQEHLALASMAEAAGDVELAQQIADMLIAAVGQQEVAGAMGADAAPMPADPAPAEDLPPDPNADPLGADPVAESQAPAIEPDAGAEVPEAPAADVEMQPDAAALADKLKSAWNVE